MKMITSLRGCSETPWKTCIFSPEASSTFRHHSLSSPPSKVGVEGGGGMTRLANRLTDARVRTITRAGS